MADALSSGGSDRRSCGFNSRQPHHLCMMDDALIERVKQWNIASVLPLQVGDFKLSTEFRMIQEKGEDVEYRIFTYRNEAKGWTVRATIHGATGEYFIRTDIGMLEFALIEFITDDFEAFSQMVEKRLPKVIHEYYDEPSCNFSVIIQNKGIPQVDWDAFLPDHYKRFQRLIKPNEAIKIINGSYMILAYYDKETRSGLSLMFNVLRDDFFAERRIHNFPNLVHDFDGQDLKVLGVRLKERIIPVLDAIDAEVVDADTVQ